MTDPAAIQDPAQQYASDLTGWAEIFEELGAVVREVLLEDDPQPTADQAANLQNTIVAANAYAASGAKLGLSPDEWRRYQAARESFLLDYDELVKVREQLEAGNKVRFQRAAVAKRQESWEAAQ